MANPKHLAILKQGVEVWNKWRDANRDVQPDLIGANLAGADLSGANLKDANLFSANLQGADLRWAYLIKANLFESNLREAKLFRADLSMANFVRANLFRANLCRARMFRTNLSRANLCRANLHEASLPRAILFGARLAGANLKGADLSEANLNSVDLSGAIIDKNTNLQRTKDVVPGVNGIYSNSTDSAALIVLSTRGDSMLGPNADAVIQSLTRARRYHGFSLGMALLALAVLIMSPPDAALWDFGDYRTPLERFSLFALIFTAGTLSFVKAFLEDGLDGTRCIRDRESAMAVGRFPWLLTRFTGHRWDKRLFSLASRFCLAFHPAIYLFIPRETISWYDWVLAAIIATFSVWIFVLSQKFQRPILFDSKTEYYRKRDLNALAAQIEELLDQMKNGDKVKKIGQAPAKTQLQGRQPKAMLEPVRPPERASRPAR